MNYRATTTAAGLALALASGLAHARATEVTPLNCGPAGPSAAPNTTPQIYPSGTNLLIEPAATAANPRVYLEIQLLSGNLESGQYAPVWFTLDGTNAATSMTGQFMLIQPGDRWKWSVLSGAGGAVLYQGPIYAAAGPNGGTITCKVYPQ